MQFSRENDMLVRVFRNRFAGICAGNILLGCNAKYGRRGAFRFGDGDPFLLRKTGNGILVGDLQVSARRDRERTQAGGIDAGIHHPVRADAGAQSRHAGRVHANHFPGSLVGRPGIHHPASRQFGEGNAREGLALAEIAEVEGEDGKR